MDQNLRAFFRIINKRQILIGLVGLLIGVLVYLTDRAPDQTYFVYSSPYNISLYNTTPNFFGSIGNSLPTFIHVFSFILITAGFIADKKRDYIFICLGWFFIDCAFELGQKFKVLSSAIVPEWFGEIPFLEATKSYFQYGSFSYFDLFSIAIGALIAYATLYFTRKELGE